MEMLIVTPDANLRLLEYSLKDIIEYLKPETINIAANISTIDDKTRDELKNAGKTSVNLIDISDIYEGLNFGTLKRELERLTEGTVSDYCVEWYLQQFVKLGYALKCDADDYLLMESDLIPLKPLTLYDREKRPVLFSQRGVDTGFAATVRILTGYEQDGSQSYSTGIMPVNVSFARELIDHIENEPSLTGIGFWIRILNSIDPDGLLKMSFSLYDTYAAFAINRHPGVCKTVRLSVLHRARRLLGKQPAKELKCWAGRSFNCMRLRRSDRPSETLIKINSTGLFRTLIPAAVEDFVDRYFELLSDKWVKICKFSVRETIGNETNRIRNFRKYIEGKKARKNYRGKTEESVTDGCVVLTHSGTRPIPEYAIDCVEQIRLFCKIPVIFVCSREKEIPKRLGEIAKIVYIEDLPVSERHLKFFRKLSSFKANFDNFFQHATERFFIIDEAMEYLNLKNVIHMENDIMLYEDAYVLLDKIKKHYDDITVPRMTEQFCMAAVMYIPDKDRMEHFLDYVIEHILDRKSNDVKKKTNDMIILADYLRENGKNALPIINRDYIDEYGLINSRGEKAPLEYIEDYCGLTEDFGGIFDPAPIGQYLGGTDRKPKGVANNAGYSNEYSYVDVSKLDISWKRYDKLYVPILKWKDKEYRIYDLHVHCKELNRFGSNIERTEG